jgi:phosphoglycerate dehydrogenase-like enzyme
MEPIAVAAAPQVQKTLDRLRAGGHLRVPVRLVGLDDDGCADPDRAAGVRVLWRRGVNPDDWFANALATLPELAWIHSDMVGADRLPLDELAARGLVVTNGGDNFARPMAEWVMLSMLAAAKRFPDFVRRSDAGRWDPSPFLLSELEGALLLLLGFGMVGRQVAEMARPFGMDVRAVVRSPRDDLPAGVSRLVTGPAWRDELPDADYVVLAMPLTPETEGMLDADALAAMKPTAWLVNVARGALVDEDALVAALDADRLGGAVLDAFTTEPLPAGHPLWSRENVIVVPHHTWSSPHAAERAARLFATELDRFAAGQPPENPVDLQAGY